MIFVQCSRSENIGFSSSGLSTWVQLVFSPLSSLGKSFNWLSWLQRQQVRVETCFLTSSAGIHDFLSQLSRLQLQLFPSLLRAFFSWLSSLRQPAFFISSAGFLRLFSLISSASFLISSRFSSASASTGLSSGLPLVLCFRFLASGSCLQLVFLGFSFSWISYLLVKIASPASASTGLSSWLQLVLLGFSFSWISYLLNQIASPASAPAVFREFIVY